MPYDLFISYSRRDNVQGRVSQLVERIQSDFAAFAGRPLAPFFDATEIKGMEDWRHRILQGLRESRLLLACLSPAYLESDYCAWEFNEYLKYEVGRRYGGDGVAPIYFVEVPGWEGKDFDAQCAEWVSELRRRQRIDLRPWFLAGKEALHESAVEAGMQKLNEQLAERIQRGERAESSLGNVDAHNAHFIGRVSELRRMRETIALGQVGVLTAVHGLGGVGKTALAIEYAHAFAHEYGGGRWQVRCEGKADLRAAICELGVPLGIEFGDEERIDLERQFQRVLRELRQLADRHEPHRCLLLLDNVDQPKLLEPAQAQRLPAADWMHVIATTRLGEDELYGAQKDRAFLPVDELPENDALELIESYQPDGRFREETERVAAVDIVRLLDRFTLAVEAAAVYIGHYANDVSCAAFLERLKREGLEGLDTAAGQSAEGVRHGEKRLGATLQPTLEQLSGPEILAMRYAALLPADYVALPWLRELVAEAHPEFGRDAEPGYPDPWRTLLHHLFSQRLLQPAGAEDADGQPQLARVHRLVQEFVKAHIITPSQFGQKNSHDVEKTIPDCRSRKFAEALGRLISARSENLKKTTHWQNERWELDPLEALGLLWADEGCPRASWLLNAVGLQRHHLAEWKRAEPLMRRALSIDENCYGPRHTAVAISLNNLAMLLSATNELDEAEPLMRRALNIDENCYGLQHSTVAIRLNNLASILQSKNQLVEAESLLRRALSIDEENRVPPHPIVAKRLNNLALLLQSTSRLDEAEPLLRRALEIDEGYYGPRNPTVAIRLNNLAELFRASRRLLAAEPMYRRALDIDEKHFGPHHPTVAIRLNNLALLLQATNRLDQAEPLCRRALDINEHSYGPDHPRVATSLNGIARILQAQNRPTEAEPLIRRALNIDEKCYGPDHPRVAIRLNNLARLLLTVNRYSEAEPMFVRTVCIFFHFTTTTGHRHPDLTIATNNYSALLLKMGLSKKQAVTKLTELASRYGVSYDGCALVIALWGTQIGSG